LGRFCTAAARPELIGRPSEEAREVSEQEANTAPPMTLREGLRRWFLRPPRPHGDVIEDRTVSFLELFYDLVYVVLVGQLAHTLAEDVSWSGVLDFAVVRSLRTTKAVPEPG
jgi:Bacterial low temperature requirement A protein (LtrA)